MPASEARVDPCPECGGRGWVVVADGGAGTARACSCRETEAIPRLLTAAGIPARYQNCKISTFQTSGGAPRERAQLMNARASAERYVEEFVQDAGAFRQSGLLFIGPPGTGKTHLAVGVLRALVERFRVRGLFVEFTSLIHQIQSTFDPNSPESKRQVLDPLANAELLVLDELGAQQPTPWVRDILYLIINNRYTRRLPTLFTTNYRLDAAAPKTERIQVSGRTTMVPKTLDRGRDPEGAAAFDETVLLSSRLPAMLVSRLYEMAQPVKLDAVEDFRREHAVHGAHLR
jgi:DNA replication protein DnaC